MLLQSKDGIACDFCGTRFKNKFAYYSLKATQYRVANNMKLPGTNPKFAKDMCTNCYDGIVEEVMKSIGPNKRGTIKDDLSKDYATGNFEYWVVLFDKVEVDKELSADDQISVEKQVLDLNIVHFDKFRKRTDKVEEQLKKTGAWS